MAASRIETAIVFGLLVTAAGGAAAAWKFIKLPAAPPALAANAQTPTTPPAAVSDPAQSDMPPPPAPPFVATVANESSWRPDKLPVDWPHFTKLPHEKPLSAKPTQAKIDAAKAIIQKWNAYLNVSNKSTEFPSHKEIDLVIRQLLTIPRSDPEFPTAWALFINVRQLDQSVTREIARLEAERKAKAELKRNARHRGVSIGMTPEEAKGSNWGKPRSVNTTITAGGRHEQWVYGGGNYLYFDNGRLTSIQTGP